MRIAGQGALGVLSPPAEGSNREVARALPVRRIVRGLVFVAMIAVAAATAVYAVSAPTVPAPVPALRGATAVNCTVGVPGYPSVRGAGTTRHVGGYTVSSCAGTLQSNVMLPRKTLRFNAGPCTISAFKSGRVTAKCRSTTAG